MFELARPHFRLWARADSTMAACGFADQERRLIREAASGVQASTYW